MKENIINIILKTLRMAIMVLGVILIVIIVSSSVADESRIEAEASYGEFLDWMFYIIYTVGIASALAAVLFGLVTFVIKLVNDFKSQIGTLAGMSVFLLIGFLSYFAFADGTVMSAYESSGLTVTESESVFAGGSLIYVYLLGIVAVASIVWAEVSSIFK
jgi:hypothetical protein|tara:strand:- start:55 stop:534 length:480 start_codon:yes stop_codon:yes gene_type:complete